MAQQGRDNVSESSLLNHLPLVRSIAWRVRRRLRYVEVDDLVSAGTLGLIEAAERYDQRRGVPLASFAYSRIRGAMLDEARRQRRPSLNGAAQVLAEPEPVSLETLPHGEGRAQLIDVTEDTSAPAPDAYLELQELLEAVADLPQRERDMLALRAQGYTVREIGELYGCSEARASQLLTKARLRVEESVAA